MKKLLLMFVGFFCTFFLFAQEKPIMSHSLENSIVIQNTSIEELIFEDGKQISKLHWQQYADPAVRITYNGRLHSAFLKLEYTSSIPIKSGILEDYDYSYLSGAITNYSKHDLYLDKNFSIQTQLGYKFDFVDIYSLQPFVGFTYQNRKFSAQDGFLQYPDFSGEEWNDTIEKEPVRGVVILYEQALISPYIGLENFFLFDKFGVSLSAIYFPYTFVDALDSHILRQAQFYDEMDGGYGFTIGTSVSFPVEKKSTVALKFGFEYEYFNSYGTTSSNIIGATNENFLQSEGISTVSKRSAFRFLLGAVINPSYWM